MAKKNMGISAVDKLMEDAANVAESARLVSSAISKVQIDNIPDAQNRARELLAYSRDILECAMSLFSRNELQHLQAANDESGVALEKLRAKFKS